MQGQGYRYHRNTSTGTGCQRTCARSSGFRYRRFSAGLGTGAGVLGYWYMSAGNTCTGVQVQGYWGIGTGVQWVEVQEKVFSAGYQHTA